MQTSHWNASDYAQHSSMQYDYAMKILKRYTFQPKDAILDIGCGDGKISVLMAKEVPQGRVVGIDSSASMIAHAKQFEKDQANLAFEQKDATQLGFSQAFDWVTSFSCFHWIADQRAVWEGIHRALKPMGHAAVLFFKKQPLFWNAVDKTVADPAWASFFQDYEPPVHRQPYECSEADYARMLVDCGFIVDFMEEKTCVYSFENIKTLENFVAAWLPHLSKIPVSMHAKFMAQLCEYYVDIVPIEPSGIATMPFTHRIFVVSM